MRRRALTYQELEEIKTKLKAKNEIVPGELKVPHSEFKFMAKLTDVLKHNYQNSDFDVEALEKALELGHATCYRKIKAFTNQTPGALLRSYRLKAAAQFRGKNYTIAEIAYQVGFNDPKYFSRCFKTQFGIPPTKFFK